jgi:hypothetical protein
MTRSYLNLIKAAALAAPLALGGVAVAQNTGAQPNMPHPESSDTGTQPPGQMNPEPGGMNAPSGADTGSSKESGETTTTTTKKKKEKKETTTKTPSGSSGAPDTNPPK